MTKWCCIAMLCMTALLGSQSLLAGDTIFTDSVTMQVWEVVANDTFPFPAPEHLKPTAPVQSAQVSPRKGAASYVLDSVISTDQNGACIGRLLYDYNAAGKTIRTTTWKYTNGIPTASSTMNESAFDGSREVMTASYKWNTTLGKWVGNSRTENTYNAQGYNDAKITYSWGTAYQFWTPTGTTTYTNYVASNKVGDQTSYKINSTTKSIEPATTYHKEWDAAGNLVLDIYYAGMTNGEWGAANSTKKVYQYTQVGTAQKKVLDEQYKWNATAKDFVGSSKEELTYDQWGNTILDIVYNAQSAVGGEWPGKTKKIYEFDSKKNRLLYEYYSSFSNGAWVGSTKEQCEYNASNKQTRKLTYSWDKTAKDWTNKTLDTTLYSGSNVTLTASYTWTAPNWIGKTRTAKTYDAAGRVTEQVDFEWDNPNLRWLNHLRTVKSYNAAGKSLQDDLFVWRNGAWQDSAQTSYSYDAQGREVLNQTRLRQGEGWGTGSKTETTYNDHGDKILTATSAWDATAQDWTITAQSRYDVTYDAANHKTHEANYTWNTTTSSWVGSVMTDNEYDANGNQILSARSVWESNKWVYDWKSEFAYNAQNKKIYEIRYNMILNQWVGSYKNYWTFDASGRQIETISYTWNTKRSDWEGLSRSQTIYNGNRKVQEISYAWSYERWDWDGMFNTLYVSFDAAGRNTEKVLQRYNTTAQSWYNDVKNVYAYDTKGNIIVSNEYAWIDGAWVANSQSEKTYDTTPSRIRTELNVRYSNGIVTSYEQKTYHYSDD